MRGLLDLTDNLDQGKVVHPDRVRVLDGDDPYLVVAADKGTATFSDTANSVSAEYGFWLGDAFASGGSAGFDHKKLGITARGAWESVKRHFRELGIDVMSTPFTVVGIGDMSGDVFGNGMLLSPFTRLVAAFDHRHVFVDPDADVAVGFEERRRLFDLPGSSWDDYDRTKISPAGAVFDRKAKSVTPSPQARAALGIPDAAPEEMTPNELIKAILKAPVDLLWNGGIGTYVKSSKESNAEAGDRTNDQVRINGNELRARVVGEGGNLGCTQLGRIEYALSGGRINTDFIDNSAGVDTSDHEVNWKILLGLAVSRGELTWDARNELLQTCAGDVVEHVLYDNYLQAQILSQEMEFSASRIDAYEDLMLQMVADGELEREVEFLPTSEEMLERRANGQGMVRPELAVLLAYAKRSIATELLGSDLPDSEYLQQDDLQRYFPPAIVERFGHLIAEHPLKRELIATIVANDIVNSSGVTFVSRMVTETGSRPADVVRAYRIARDVTGAVERWEAIEALDVSIAPHVQSQLMNGVDYLVETASRWYLVQSHGQRLSEAIADQRTSFAELSSLIGRIGPDAWREEHEQLVRRLVSESVPDEIARRHAFQGELVHGPDIIAVAHATGWEVLEVARAFFVLGERVGLDWLEHQLEALPVGTHWQRWAAQSMEDDLFLVRRQLVERVIARTSGSLGRRGDRRVLRAADRGGGAVAAVHQEPVGRRRHGPGAVHGRPPADPRARRLATAAPSVEDLQRDPVEAVHVDDPQAHVVEPGVEQDAAGGLTAEPCVADPAEASTLAEVLPEDGAADVADQVGQVGGVCQLVRAGHVSSVVVGLSAQPAVELQAREPSARARSIDQPEHLVAQLVDQTAVDGRRAVARGPRARRSRGQGRAQDH